MGTRQSACLFSCSIGKLFTNHLSHVKAQDIEDKNGREFMGHEILVVPVATGITISAFSGRRPTVTAF